VTPPTTARRSVTTVPPIRDDERVTGRITWLGHSTVLIELGSLRVLTDPLLRGRVAHLRRHAPVPRTPERLDAILLSHLHRDHADVPSLRRLPGVRLLGPAGASTLRGLDGREVVTVAPGERTPIGDGSVLAVHAEHDGRRYPFGRPEGALGFVIEAGGTRVYFAGDTDVFAGMAELGPLDVALLPVWGWGTSIGSGHLDPEGAARAAALLRPRVAIPIHWATYFPLHRGAGHALLREPGPAFATAVAKHSPDVRVTLLAPGEAVEVP
jgi:L-ascorbate metabolism protein UlaG (beta-lactamase superfamily)